MRYVRRKCFRDIILGTNSYFLSQGRLDFNPRGVHAHNTLPRDLCPGVFHHLIFSQSPLPLTYVISLGEAVSVYLHKEKKKKGFSCVLLKESEDLVGSPIEKISSLLENL